MSGKGRARSVMVSLGLVAAAFGALGCQALLGIEDTRVDDEGGPTGRGFTFAVLTTSVALPLDGTAVIDVEIARMGGFDGDVTVAPTFLPSGLVAPSIVIPAGASSGELAVGAVAPLMLGNEIDFELQATSAELATPRAVSISKARVTGKPGALDPSFGPTASGVTRISIGGDNGRYVRVAIAGDGKLFAVGSNAASSGVVSMVMARLSADGLPDATFNSNGEKRITFAGGTSEAAVAVASGFQPDGRIVVMGSHQNQGNSLGLDAALARVPVNGVDVSDPFFGNYQSGKSLLDFGGGDTLRDGVVLRSGSIVATGDVSSGVARLMLFKTDANGYLDPTFASAGSFKDTTGTASVGQALVVDKQDRIVVVGSIDNGADRDMLVLRFTPQGQLDVSFGNGGRVVLGSPTFVESGAAIALRPDGRILIAGTSNANGNTDFQLRQLLDSGAPDDSFGQAGVSTPLLTSAGESAFAMALLPNGRAVVVGTAGNTPMIARYTKTGALDPYFSVDGFDPVPLGSYGVMGGVTVSADGRKVIVCGGDEGGSPGPGTFGVLVRMWM